MSELAAAESNTLPAVISLNDKSSYDVWVIWRATDRRFLPSQILDEPEAMLSDMLLLDSIFEKLKEVANGTKNN